MIFRRANEEQPLSSLQQNKRGSGWQGISEVNYGAEEEEVKALDFSQMFSTREERECGGMSGMVTPCPHFIPQLWPAALRSASQYKPDTWNHRTFGHPANL